MSSQFENPKYQIYFDVNPGGFDKSASHLGGFLKGQQAMAKYRSGPILELVTGLFLTDEALPLLR